MRVTSGSTPNPRGALANDAVEQYDRQIRSVEESMTSRELRCAEHSRSRSPFRQQSSTTVNLSTSPRGCFAVSLAPRDNPLLVVFVHHAISFLTGRRAVTALARHIRR